MPKDDTLFKTHDPQDNPVEQWDVLSLKTQTPQSKKYLLWDGGKGVISTWKNVKKNENSLLAHFIMRPIYFCWGLTLATGLLAMVPPVRQIVRSTENRKLQGSLSNLAKANKSDALSVPLGVHS